MKINTNLTLPDFLIVGAAKSGTTTVFDLLNRHPQLSLSNIKEPHYFSYPGEKVLFNSINNSKEDPRYITNLKDYCNLFDVNGKITGEASTHYLYLHKTTIPNIINLYGEKSKHLKIIIILRNPVGRAYSHYNMKVRNGVENLSFQEAISSGQIKDRFKNNFSPSYDYIGFSSYYSQVEAYKRAFPDVLVLLFEDFLSDKKLFFIKLFKFLNVDYFDVGDIKKLNVSGLPSNNFTAYLKKIIFEKSAIKELFKFIIPSKKRSIIKHTIGKNILKKQPMPEDIEEQLTEVFKTETKLLSNKFSLDLSTWMKI